MDMLVSKGKPYGSSDMILMTVGRDDMRDILGGYTEIAQGGNQRCEVLCLASIDEDCVWRAQEKIAINVGLYRRIPQQESVAGMPERNSSVIVICHQILVHECCEE